jgi:hypothetical protein
MDTQAALSVVDCLTLILDGLLKAIAAKIADYPFTSEMVTNLWNLVNTVKNCFLRLAALVQAGNISRERPAKPRARRRGEVAKASGDQLAEMAAVVAVRLAVPVDAEYREPVRGGAIRLALAVPVGSAGDVRATRGDTEGVAGAGATISHARH